MMAGEGEPPTLKDIEQKRMKNFIENSILFSVETRLTAPQMLGSNKLRIRLRPFFLLPLSQVSKTDTQ